MAATQCLLQVLALLLSIVALSSAAGEDYWKILRSINKGDMKKLKRVLSKADSYSLNHQGSGGQTPLMYSVLTGKTAAVKALLEAGADVTIAEKDGYTPMHGAGFQGRADIAKLLVAHGVSAADVHKDGYTPLHRACWGTEDRHTEAVKFFLELEPAETKRHAIAGCLRETRNVGTNEYLTQYEA
jgi:ankyrin repeat protein